MKSTLTFLSALLLALLAVNGSRPVYAADETATKKSVGTTDRAELVIDTDTVFEVNGVSIVPDGLFGVTAYNGPETATDERWRALLIDSGLRWVGIPGNPGWLLPPEAPPGFAAGWADTPAAAALLDHHRGGYHIPSCLTWRDIGIEPMLYLGLQGIFKWSDSGDGEPRHPSMPPLFPVSPLDIERAGVEWGEYVALLKRVDPKLTWIHLENEPNAHWFRFKKGGHDYAALFEAVAKGIKKRNPDIKIGGPVLCWPPSFPPTQYRDSPWYTWDSYTMPLIEMAGEQLDFFDFHLYGGSSTLGMEEVQTVANAMWLKTGRRKPVMISEYGAYLRTDDDMRSVERVWDSRVAPWQRQVMDFLDFQPDKGVSLQSHDLRAQAGGNFRVIKGLDPDDQFAFAKMYRTWAPLKGRRLLASSSDPEVRVFAAQNVSSLSGKGRLALVLVNTSDQVKNVTVRVEGTLENPPIDATVPVKGSYIRPVDCAWQGPAVAASGAAEGIQRTDLGGAIGGMADGPVAAPADAEPLSAAKPEATPVASRARVESGTFLSDRPVYAFTLAPRETRSVEYALAQAAAPTKSRWTRDVFGDVVHREFEKPGDSVEVTFNLAGMGVAGADKAAIRVGLLGARKGDKVNMKIGDFVCQLVQQDWFQSVSLPTVPQGGEIKAVFTLLARGEPEILLLRLRFGSATAATMQFAG